MRVGPLSEKDCEEIWEAFEQRQKNFPGEPSVMTLALVLQNIGRREMQVECVGGEFTGKVTDVPPQGSKTPLCPNGHEIHMLDQGLGLFWIRRQNPTEE